VTRDDAFAEIADDEALRRRFEREAAAARARPTLVLHDAGPSPAVNGRPRPPR
jgi:hypothetical protein